MPLRLPDGSEIVASRVSVHVGTNLRAPSLPSELKIGDVHVTLALQLRRDSSGAQWCRDFALKMQHSKRLVRREDPTQRVLSELGSPTDVHHVAGGGGGGGGGGGTLIQRRGSSGGESDYFFNYHHLGFDIMFDGVRHVVKKVVCHNNVPGCVDFGVYRRCHFRLMVQWSGGSAGGSGGSNGNGDSGGSGSEAGSGRSGGTESEGAVVASSRSAWTRVKEQIEKWVGEVEGPMVCGGVARRVSGGDGGSSGVYEYGGGQSVVVGEDGLLNATSCGGGSGDTLLYGMTGAVFEVVGGDHSEKVVVFACDDDGC